MQYCNDFFRHHWQIPTKNPGVAQGCHLGNQAGFVLGPHECAKKFIGMEVHVLALWSDYWVLYRIHTVSSLIIITYTGEYLLIPQPNYFLQHTP